MPRVSVILPVFNGEQYLHEAIQSILGQTFQDFEVLAINDGSSDRSLDVLERIRDPRFRIIDNGANLGLPRSLNKGIEEARGEYIARQDADDRSHPERLQRQVRYLDAHPGVGLLGSSYWIMNEAGEVIGMQAFSTTNAKLQKELLYSNPFCHPSVMMRRNCLGVVGSYCEDFVTSSEDYDLWLRLAEVCEIGNLSQPLLYYRRHGSSITGRRELIGRVQDSLKAQKRALERRLKVFRPEDESLGKQLASAYLAVACREFMLGMEQQARHNVIAAVELGQVYLDEWEFWAMVEAAVTYPAVSWFGWNTGVEAIKALFNDLPHYGPNSQDCYRRLLSGAYRHVAFEAYEKGNSALTRKAALRAWHIVPIDFFANLGLFSIFLETVLGRDLMAHVRAVTHRFQRGNLGSQ